MREYLPIVIALEMWSTTLSNIVLHSDNLAVVHNVFKNTSKDSNLMRLMKRLIILSLTFNIHFSAEHIQGITNVAADLLSRLQVSEFRAKFQRMSKQQTPVPPSLVKI